MGQRVGEDYQRRPLSAQGRVGADFAVPDQRSGLLRAPTDCADGSGDCSEKRRHKLGHLQLGHSPKAKPARIRRANQGVPRIFPQEKSLPQRVNDFNTLHLIVTVLYQNSSLAPLIAISYHIHPFLLSSLITSLTPILLPST